MQDYTVIGYYNSSGTEPSKIEIHSLVYENILNQYIGDFFTGYDLGTFKTLSEARKKASHEVHEVILKELKYTFDFVDYKEYI